MIGYLLIGLNVLVSFIAFPHLRTEERAQRFMFAPSQVAQGRNLQGMILSHFSHADMAHLLFNMITLYFFAPVVEQGLGPLGFLLIYAAGGAVSTLLIFLLHRGNPRYRSLGASDSVTGIIFAAIVLAPGMYISFLFVPIPIPAPIFAVGYIALSSYFMGKQGRISHEAHLAGAFTGLILCGLLSPQGFEPLLYRIREIFS